MMKAPVRGASRHGRTSRALPEDRIVIAGPGSEDVVLECEAWGSPYEEPIDDYSDEEA